MHSSHLRAPFALLALTAALTAFADDGGNDALTIYSTATPGAVAPDMTRNGGSGYSVPGYATVRHEREIALNAGRNTVRFIDVAGLIDPTTVSFTSLTDTPGTRVMEQNFQFDLVSPVPVTPTRRSNWWPATCTGPRIWDKRCPWPPSGRWRTWRKRSPVSRKRRSSSITSTRWDVPARFRTTRPNRSNCSRKSPMSPAKRRWCTTGRTGSGTAAGR